MPEPGLVCLLAAHEAKGGVVSLGLMCSQQSPVPARERGSVLAIKHGRPFARGHVCTCVLQSAWLAVCPSVCLSA